MTDKRELKIGDRIKDNDPRPGFRRTEIVQKIERNRFGAGVAVTENTRIRLDYIHTDGKPRRSGWSLVQ